MKRRQHFTLVEILIVIGIIAVLAGMLLVGLNSATGKAEFGKAKSEITNLKNAIAAFELEYNKLPKPKDYTSTNADDDPAALTSAQYTWLIKVLQGEELTATEKSNYGDPNKRKKSFLPTQGNTRGEYKDPWDNDYNVVFEWKYDKGINNKKGIIPGLKADKDSSNDRWIRHNVIIWSEGSDGKSKTGKDDDDWKDDDNEDNVYSLDTSWSPKVGHTISR